MTLCRCVSLDRSLANPSPLFPLACGNSSARTHSAPSVLHNRRSVDKLPTFHILGMQCLVSLSDGLAGYTFPLHGPKTTRGFNRPDWATNRMRDAERRLARASCGPLLPYHEPLRLHFGGVLGALQTLARVPQGTLHCPPHATHSSLPSQKPTPIKRRRRAR